jgi:hypothetical protein
MKAFKIKLQKGCGLKSAIYESTACLDLPMALPISEGVNLIHIRGFLLDVTEQKRLE